MQPCLLAGALLDADLLLGPAPLVTVGGFPAPPSLRVVAQEIVVVSVELSLCLPHGSQLVAQLDSGRPAGRVDLNNEIF